MHIQNLKRDLERKHEDLNKREKQLKSMKEDLIKYKHNHYEITTTPAYMLIEKELEGIKEFKNIVQLVEEYVKHIK